MNLLYVSLSAAAKGGGEIPVGVPLFLRVTLKNEWGENIDSFERKRAGDIRILKSLLMTPYINTHHLLNDYI